MAAYICVFACAVQPARVFAPVPFYSGYAYPAAYYASRLFEWTAEAAPVPAADAPVIELITAPNNPDGVMRTKSISGILLLPPLSLCFQDVHMLKAYMTSWLSAMDDQKDHLYKLPTCPEGLLLIAL